MSNKFIHFALGILIALNTGCGSSDQNNESKNTFQYRPQLQQFSQCDELKHYLIETAEKQRQLYYWEYPDYSGSEDSADASPPATSDEGNASSEISDMTGTNNQVEGVDEADFVKTTADGYTYLLSGGYFLILKTWPAAQSQEIYRVQLEGNPRALFVDGEIVWIVSDVYSSDLAEENPNPDFAPRINETLKISIFQVNDPQQPELLRETLLESQYVDARMIDHQVYLIVSAYLNLFPFLDNPESIDLNDLLPAMSDNTTPAQQAGVTTRLISECDAIYRPETANGTGTVSILSFNLENPLSEISSESLLSNTGLVYATLENLYIATTEDNYWMWLPVMEGDDTPSPGTNIHKFSLTTTPQYLASGRVDGMLINRFAMDEYQGNLRLVTSSMDWWQDSQPKNRLYILEQSDDELVERSRLEGLGKPGDTIYAARFMQDKGFLVTFRQIDPFYTLDLSNADQPKVVGELEVPGYSTYLHPISDNMILTIGRDTDINGLMITLFDISDFQNPSRLSNYSISADSYSQAEYNHHAFTWFAAEDMLAIPVSRWNISSDPTPFSYDNIFNGLELFRVTLSDGIQPYASIDHDIFYRDENNENWYYPDAIQRSFFVSDDQENSYLYSISSRGFMVNGLASPQTNLAEIPLPSYANDYFYGEE
jgi:uncharacterized secreted protein with C-terminal beta-propeller domain